MIALASGEVGAWIDGKAHMLGHALDRAVRAVADGKPGAWTALIGGSAFYGFLHALGPGHGKVLVGGVGAAVQAHRALRLMAGTTLVVLGLAMLAAVA